MTKRRIIGISYKEDSRILIDKQISLMDKGISKIFYIDLDEDDKVTLDYTTFVEFHTPDGSEINPDNYAPTRQYVNCFLAEARLGGVKKVMLPRPGTSVPVFGEKATMLLLGKLGNDLAYVYINQDIGVVRISLTLLEQITSCKDAKGIVLSDDDNNKQELTDLLGKLKDTSLLGEGNTDIAFMSWEDTVSIKGWAVDKFRELYERNEWYRRSTPTAFDLVCKKFANGPKEMATMSEIFAIAEELKQYIGTPVYAKDGQLMDVEVLKFTDTRFLTPRQKAEQKEQLQKEKPYKSKLESILASAKLALIEYWGALVNQRADGYFGRVGKGSNLDVKAVSGVRQESVGSQAQSVTQGTVGAQEAEADKLTQQAEVGEGLDAETLEIWRMDCKLLGVDYEEEESQDESEVEGAEEVVIKKVSSFECSDKQKEEINSMLSDLGNIADLGEQLTLLPNKPTDDSEEEVMSLVGEAKERLDTSLITSAVKNIAGQTSELEALGTNNCVANCPICGGRGVYQESIFGTLAICPNKVSVEAEKKSKIEIVEKLQTSPKVKQAVMQGLVPKKFINAIWDPEKAIENLREIANANRLEIDTREAQEYKKVLSLILSGLATGRMPEFSYLISAPNGSGKANFAYTALKLLVLKGKAVAPYITLMELAELRKRYLLWVGNLSEKELAINKATDEESYSTAEFNTELTKPLEDMTDKEKEDYLRGIYKVNFKYTDFLSSDFLVCSMSSDKTQLPLEISTLKSILEYRARRCKPTLVFTELQLSTLEFAIAYGDCLDGLYTCTTKSRDYADYDRLWTVSVKPKRLKV